MSDEDLELFITLDDPVPAQEDTFNHLQINNLGYWFGQSPNKKLNIEVWTITRWKNGEIVEQKVFEELAAMQRQIGMM